MYSFTSRNEASSALRNQEFRRCWTGADMLSFHELPKSSLSLSDDELALLALLPYWPSVIELQADETKIAHRLAKRGLVKITRQKSNAVCPQPTVCAGKMATVVLSKAVKP
jgi:hypothetical protein